MAVQILNDMPDAAVHRGDLADFSVRARTRRANLRAISGRAVFMAATIGVHLIAAAAFMSIRQEREAIEPEPIMATMMESSSAEAEPPRDLTPPPVDVVYSLHGAAGIDFRERSSRRKSSTTAISPTHAAVVAPPMVESVEYVRAASARVSG